MIYFSDATGLTMDNQVKRDWENFFMDQGYRLSDYYTQYMLTHNTWTITEKLQEISSELSWHQDTFEEGQPNTPIMIDVTQDELQRHIDDFLARLSIEVLVTGNMHKDVRIFSG